MRSERKIVDDDEIRPVYLLQCIMYFDVVYLGGLEIQELLVDLLLHLLEVPLVHEDPAIPLVQDGLEILDLQVDRVILVFPELQQDLADLKRSINYSCNITAYARYQLNG